MKLLSKNTLKIILLVYLGFTLIFSACQNTNQDKKQVEEIINEESNHYVDDYLEQSIEETTLDKEYFKKFDKIELAYYPHSQRSYGTMPNCSNLIRNKVFEVDSLEKKVALNPTQRKQFEEIAFTKPTQKEWQPSDCFRPRHSLIFYEKEQATHIIEVCFDCSDVCYFPTTFPTMNLVYKLEEMEELFKKMVEN